ncbi:unnamed protein product [Ilex paraguariensis]|uniref:Protein DA1-like domain-containing protein n=1 Tax=Ilex paraguariensis TaxID=185542 RepID=A0ABC8RIQ4_9AQUA
MGAMSSCHRSSQRPSNNQHQWYGSPSYLCDACKYPIGIVLLLWIGELKKVYMRLESFSAGDAFESWLKKYSSDCIKYDSSPLYGAGYNMAKRAVGRYGLQATLIYIAQTRRLPG